MIKGVESGESETKLTYSRIAAAYKKFMRLGS